VKDLHGSQAIDAVDVHAGSLRCCSVELDDAPLESDREWNGMMSNHTRCSLFRILNALTHFSGWWISMFAQVKLKGVTRHPYQRGLGETGELRSNSLACSTSATPSPLCCFAPAGRGGDW
jgi:hypothetical protein